MHCYDCFHNCVCGNSSPHNDVSMCKQFLERDAVLYGQPLQRFIEDFEKLQGENQKLRVELRSYRSENEELERELKLLRIIKQTLEMQSGKTFDI